MKRYDRVIVAVVVCVVCLFFFATLSWPAEFSADMVSSHLGQRTQNKVYVKGQKLRVEVVSPEGGAATIMDLEKGTMIMLMPQEKTYMELSGSAAQPQMAQFATAEDDIAQIADKRNLGTEKINGYLCDKYEIVYHDTSLGKMTSWFSKKLGLPLKTVHQIDDGEMVTEYTNIHEGRVSDSLFQVPPGYQKTAMPAMGSGMGSIMQMEDMENMEDLQTGADTDISELLDIFKNR